MQFLDSKQNFLIENWFLDYKCDFFIRTASFRLEVIFSDWKRKF